MFHEVSYAYSQGRDTLVKIVGDAIRKAMITAMTHEIDECLLCDDEFFTDPHPELRR